MPHRAASPGRRGDDGAVTSSRLLGVLATAAALAASQLTAAVLDVRESPVLAIAQTAIRLTPGVVAEPIISVVGTADKPITIVAVVVAMLLLGGLIGSWWRRTALERWRAWSCSSRWRRRRCCRGRTGRSAVSWLVWSVGSSSSVSSRCCIANRVDADDETGQALSRRRMLKLVGAVAVATAVAGTAGELLASRHRRRRELDRLRASLATADAPTAHAARRRPAASSGQAPWRTSNRAFYRIDTALSPPLIDPTEWRLRIHGMVERELTVTYQDLLDRGLRDAWVTLCCVSNPVGGDLISNTVFSGVPMKDLLDEAGVQSGADMLLSTSEDGWTCGTPLAALTDGRDALLAVGMDGVPLPVEHGFPVRQVVPGLYGYVSATKWVTDWEVTRFDEAEAYWTTAGMVGARADQDPVPHRRPARHVPMPAPSPWPAVAWAQHTGIDEGRGARRRRRLGGGRAGVRAVGRHLGAVALGVGRRAGRAPPPGARHRQDRLHPDVEARRRGARRCHRLPRGGHLGHLTPTRVGA